jgi:hypothetical protein
LELSLIDPSGSLVNPQTVSNDPNTDYVAFDTGYGLMATYLITTTEVGTWQYTITGYGVNPTTGYRLFAVPSTPIGVSVATPSWLPNNSPVVITATVSYSITVPLVGGTVNAQVNRPDGTSDAVILFDDGNHNDGTSNDGTFGTTYTQTAAGGFYGVVVTATGNYVGENYTRTAWSIMTIGPDNASLTGQYSDAGISDDNDEAYEWLQVTATLSVTEISTYTLSADLYAGETFITHAKTQVPLTPGTQTIALRFDGVDIYSHQLNGPYTVRNVMLLDETGTTILIETADNVHETAPYNYTQFEDGITEIYLPLVWK